MPRRVFPILFALLCLSALAFVAGSATRTAVASPPFALPEQPGAALQVFQVGEFDKTADRLAPSFLGDDGYIALNDVKPSRVGVIAALPIKSTLKLSRMMARLEPGNDPGTGAILAIAACDESLAVKRTLLPLGEINEEWPKEEFVYYAPVADPVGATVDAGEVLCWTATRNGKGNVGVAIVLQVALTYWGDPTSVLYLPTVAQE